MTIGECVEKVIKENGMTTAEAARHYGVSFCTLKNMIKGKSRPTRNTIQAMAAIEPRFKKYVESYICNQCGKDLVDTGPFCSTVCRREYHKRYSKSKKPREYDEEKEPIAYIIDKIMKDEGFTPNTLATDIGIAYGTIKRILDGHQINGFSLLKIDTKYPKYGLNTLIERQVCPICEKEYIATSVRQIGCSEECQKEVKKENVKKKKEQREAALMRGEELSPPQKRKSNKRLPPERSINIVNEDACMNNRSYGLQSIYEHLGWV